MIPGNASPLLLATAADGAAAAVGPIKSLRFNSGDSARLSRTTSSAGNRKTWTWAGWVKRSSFGSRQHVFGAVSSGSSFGSFEFNADDELRFYDNTLGDSNAIVFETGRVFRDPSAWYHIVVALDSTAGTDAERIKLYVNGVQEESSSFSTGPTVGSNGEGLTNSNNVGHNIGSWTPASSSLNLNAYLADVYFVDGSALSPTSFGAFDSSGVWQAAEYSGTFGTNGFHLLDFANESTIGHDSSGNNNDFTANNLTNDSVTTLTGVAFDGADDYLTLAGSSDFAFGTGDFTVEWFMLCSDSTANGVYNRIFCNDGPTGDSDGNLQFNIDEPTGKLVIWKGTTPNVLLGTTNICDGKWNHVAVTRSGTTLRIFVNGTQDASTTNSTNWGTHNSGSPRLHIGSRNGSGDYKGLLSNYRVIKGTALYTSNFTVPTTPLTNVTNTKLLCCQSSSSVTAATVSPVTITAVNDVSVSTRSDSSANNDVLFDVPTNGSQSDTGAGGEVSGNYATLNPLNKHASSDTISNGNLEASWSGGSACIQPSTIAFSSGKYYYEFLPGISGSIGNGVVGIRRSDSRNHSNTFAYLGNGQKMQNESASSYGSSYTDGDVIGVAVDMDAGTIRFYKNGADQGQAYSGISGTYTFYQGTFGGSNGGGYAVNFGQRPFAYSAPSGYKALCTTNLPTPTIADGSDYFEAKTYTGNGSTQAITGLGFSPDLVWIKARANTWDHALFDSVRGALKRIRPNQTTAEGTDTTTLTSFDSNGFTTGSDDVTNQNNYAYIAWAWDAGSSTVSNTDGSITSSVRANQSAGFSIVTYTGTGSNATVGHGLNAAIELVIVKTRTNGSINWTVWHKALAATQYLTLNTTNAKGTQGTVWNSTAPTSSVIHVGSDVGTNKSGDNYVAYCFAPVTGYSAFGSYTGNGSSDGPFVHTGFRPALIITKRTDATGGWVLWDTARNLSNVATEELYPDDASAEYTGGGIDILSNGFKLRNSSAHENNSGASYIYWAVAENPFQANGGLAR